MDTGRGCGGRTDFWLYRTCEAEGCAQKQDPNCQQLQAWIQGEGVVVEQTSGCTEPVDAQKQDPNCQQLQAWLQREGVVVVVGLLRFILLYCTGTLSGEQQWLQQSDTLESGICQCVNNTASTPLLIML